MAEQKMAEQKFGGTLKESKWKCKKVSGTKNAEQKLRNKNWWGLLDIGCWGPQVQVQKGQQNKNTEQKLWNKNWWGLLDIGC